MNDAKKNDQNKPPISVIPRTALEQEAQVFAFGATKYGIHNYKAGLEYTRVLDAVLRHVIAFADGEDLDPESGMSHLAHAKCGLSMLMYYVENVPEKDNRYKK